MHPFLFIQSSSGAQPRTPGLLAMLDRSQLQSLAELAPPVLTAYLDTNPAARSNQRNPHGYVISLKSHGQAIAHALKGAEKVQFRDELRRVTGYVRDNLRTQRGVVLSSANQKIDLAVLLLDADDVPYGPRSLGDLIFERPGLAVVQINVVPAVALGGQQQFCALVYKFNARFARIDVGLCFFFEDHTLLACFGIHFAIFKTFVPSRMKCVVDAFAVFVPGKVGPALEIDLDRSGFYVVGGRAGYIALSQWVEEEHS